MIKDNLVEIVCSSTVGAILAFASYNHNSETTLEHYINRRAREERVMQFERGEPQSETMWDYLQGTGDITEAGLLGLGVGVIFYTANKWLDKNEQKKKRKKALKKENPELYARLYSNEKK